MPRRVRFLYIIMCVVATMSAAAKDFTVVLDPGHGGRDYGAVGALTNEKTINLDVGLELRKLLNQHDGLKVVMTREDDRFIELRERAAIANRNHGDLFVSIHVNSVDKKNRNRQNVRGASVYALGLHRSASNFEVAKRENSVIELEADHSASYQGFNPNSTESYIIFELSQNKHLDQSISFAEMAQGELVSTAGRADRGVLQAGFWVLHASAMPAVLVELDFICNPTVEKYLHSQKGKKEMARALANAICQYAGLGGNKSSASAGDDNHDATESESDDSEASETSAAEADCPDSLTYRVQFIASDRQLPSTSFKGVERVEYYRHGGMYKYTSGGDFRTEAEAEQHAKKVRAKFPEAFIIKWQNGARVL